MKLKALSLADVCKGIAVLAAVSVLTAAAAVAAPPRPVIMPPAQRSPVGAVYAMTNASTKNEIVMFARFPNGTLTEVGRVATQGSGSGQTLTSVGSLLLIRDHWLLATNWGDSTISVFRITRDAGGLEQPVLVSVQSSGGMHPISLTSHAGLVYVLNAGGTPSIAGFQLVDTGELKQIPGSVVALPTSDSQPAQIAFAPQGEALVVSERSSNALAVYGIDTQTSAARFAFVHTAHPGGGTLYLVTPWGIAFDPQGYLYTVDAADGRYGASNINAHLLTPQAGGKVAMTEAAEAMDINQTGATAVVVTRDGGFLYVAGTMSDSISAIATTASGGKVVMRLLPPASTIALRAGHSPVALALSANDSFLYALNDADGTISAFRRNPAGGLVPVPGVFGLPAGTSGLAAE